MSTGNQLTLEAVVKATLDTRGFKATKEEIENVTASIESATEAGKALNTSAEQIVATYEKLQKSAASTTSEWERMSEAQKQDQRESAQRAVRLLEADEAQKKAGKSAATLGQNLGVLKQAAAGAGGVIGGVLTGNFQQASQGALTLSQALSKASTDMKAFFGQIARGGAIGAAIAGPSLVALAALQQKLREMAEETKKIHDDQAKGLQLYTQLVEESAARQVTALKAVTAELAEQTEAMRRRDAQVESARNRADTINPERRKLRDQQLDLEEKNALDKAKGNSEAQAKIKAKYKGLREKNEMTDKLGGFLDSAHRTGVDMNRAEDDITNARQRNAEQNMAVAAAQRQYDEALAAMDAYRKGRTTGFDWKEGIPTSEDGLSAGAIEARKRALAARENLANVKGTRDRVGAETSKIIEAAEKQIETAKLQLEVINLQRQFYTRELVQKGKEGTAAERRNIQEAIDKAEGKPADKPGSGGTITKDGKEVAVLSEKTVKSIQSAAETFGTVMSALSGFTEKVVIEGEKTRKKVERNSQAGPGGGG